MISNHEYTFYENKCENVYINTNKLMDYYEQKQFFCPYLPIYQNIPKIKPLSWWQRWLPEAIIFILFITVSVKIWNAAQNIHSILFYTGGSF